jgi:hypothetical protein
MHDPSQEHRVDRLIITGASEAYADSLLALLGSIRRNWPGAPPVRVYDIGLSQASLERLARCGHVAVKVPPFCDHWRKHYTWKTWCWLDAPARDVFWIDAGIVILAPAEEVFDRIATDGYFVVPSHHGLEAEASEAACEGCRVPPEFRTGKPTFAGCFIGFRKEGRVLDMLAEAHEVAKVERCIASAEPTNRHDQALVSLLLHRNFPRICPADEQAFAGSRGPDQVPGQRAWVHRRRMRPEDLRALGDCAASDGPPYLPRPLPTPPAWKRAWKATFGRLEAAVRVLRRRHRLVDASKYDGIRDRVGPRG